MDTLTPASSTSSCRIPAPPFPRLPPLPIVSFLPPNTYTISSFLSRSTSSTNCTSLRRRRLGVKVRCAGAVKEITQNDFSDVVLKSDRPVLVEFVATWCGPCRLIAPAIESIAQEEEYKEKIKVVKIDHDSNPQLIEEYKVYGLPTLILFKDGKEVPESRREGAITKLKLKQYLDKLLHTVSVL